MPLSFEVHVEPGSNHTRWELGKVNRLIVKVKTPDDSHAVNVEIIDAVARALGLNHSKIHLVKGVEDRVKHFKVTEVHSPTFEELLKGLGIQQEAVPGIEKA